MDYDDLFVIAKYILAREKEARDMEEQLREYAGDVAKVNKENALLKEMFEIIKGCAKP